MVLGMKKKQLRLSRLKHQVQTAQQNKEEEITLYNYSEYEFLERLGFLSYLSGFKGSVKRKTLSFPHRVRLKF